MSQKAGMTADWEQWFRLGYVLEIQPQGIPDGLSRGEGSQIRNVQMTPRFLAQATG